MSSTPVPCCQAVPFDETKDFSLRVVLSCRGQGMRLRDHSETTPERMARIGYRPRAQQVDA